MKRISLLILGLMALSSAAGSESIGSILVCKDYSRVVAVDSWPKISTVYQFTDKSGLMTRDLFSGYESVRVTVVSDEESRVILLKDSTIAATRAVNLYEDDSSAVSVRICGEVVINYKAGKVFKLDRRFVDLIIYKLNKAVSAELVNEQRNGNAGQRPPAKDVEP
ncbi:MAG: hypothetical protein WC205_16075 [Opitutaceae bacterium]|jgi:hypothetical protein